MTYFIRERTLFCVGLAVTVTVLITVPAFAQLKDASLFENIKRQDSLLFDVGFNTCNTVQIEKVISSDFEFYHDQAGATFGKDAFISDIRNGLCKLSYKAFRELEPASMEVYPLYRHDTLYGAIQTAFHRFYALKGDKPWRFTSRARFTHLWILENGAWKLKRGLSYDHKTIASDEAPDFDDSVAVVSWIRENKVPALGIGVLKNGLLEKVRMYGELDSGRPARNNSIFNVASITKAMTSMLVLRLVSDGKWKLDEPLFHYWTDPDVGKDPRSKKITTRNILNQQSGFPNWRRELPDHKLAFLADPGTKYRYSGEGFEYLRRALERKFNEPLDQLAEQLLFRPLGMKDTHYIWNDSTDSSRMAMPHNADGKPLGFDKNYRPNAADMVTTTIPDLARFLNSVWWHEGVSDMLAAEMWRPVVETKPDRYVGLGWFIYTPVGSQTFAISHGGDDAGMHTICFLLPASGNGLIIFTNSDNGPKLYASIIRAFLGKEGRDIVAIELR